MENKILKDEATTIISEAIAISGNLDGDENLTVQGQVSGSIKLSKTLTVEASGVVRAEVKVREAVIYGVVEGDVEADDRVQITAGGKMVGDIRAPRVILEDGGAFKGNIDMTVDTE